MSTTLALRASSELCELGPQTSEGPASEGVDEPGHREEILLRNCTEGEEHDVLDVCLPTLSVQS